MSKRGVFSEQLARIEDMIWQLSAQMGNRARHAGDPAWMLPRLQMEGRLRYDPMTMQSGVDPRLVEERDDKIDMLETVRSKQEAANCELAGKIKRLEKQNFAYEAQRRTDRALIFKLQEQVAMWDGANTGWARVAELEDVIAHIEKDGDERAETIEALKGQCAWDVKRMRWLGDDAERRNERMGELERDLSKTKLAYNKLVVKRDLLQGRLEDAQNMIRTYERGGGAENERLWNQRDAAYRLRDLAIHDMRKAKKELEQAEGVIKGQKGSISMYKEAADKLCRDVMALRQQ